MPAASFSTLLKDTKKTFLSRQKDFWFVIFVGTVLLGFTSSISVLTNERERNALEKELGIPITSIQMEEMGRLRFGSMAEKMGGTSLQPILAALQTKGVENPSTYLELAHRQIAAPFDAVTGLMNILWFFIGPWLYACLVFLSKKGGPKKDVALRKASKKILGIIGINILNALIAVLPGICAIALAGGLLMVHTPAILALIPVYAWIVFLGIVGPRLALAPVFYILDGSTVMKALKKAYRSTHGYWSKIVGNALLVMLLLVVPAIVSIIIVTIIGAILKAISPVLGLLAVTLLFVFIHEWVFAVCVIFATKMTETIADHPKKK